MEPKDRTIVDSHERCRKLYNMHPDHFPVHKVCISESELERKKDRLRDVISVARKFMTKLITDLQGVPVLIAISDHEEYNLEMYGDEMMKKQAESLGISVGVCMKEEAAGTNSSSLSIRLEQPILIKGTDHFHRILHQLACFSVPFYHVDRLGGTITVMMTVHDANSFHLGLLCSAVDSIEREVKVNEQNKRLLILNQVIIENSRNGIIMTNETGNIIELNTYAERVLACNREEIVNNPITKVATIGTYMENVVKENRKYEDIEIKISDKIFLFDSFPIYDENNQIIGAFGQFRDITERLLLEKQVMASEKLSAIGKISAGLAHEIRNPLTSIIGLLKLIKRNVTATEPRHEEFFKIIFSELERIKSLVHQFVMLAKPEQKEISKSKIRIRELIEDVILLMESLMSSKYIKVTYDYDASCEESIHVDSDKMKQVLINILQNSFDAIEYNGEIRISTNCIADGNGIEIIIKDDGEGMDKDTLERISTPFFTTKKSGLGLGLSMSFNIIELHKGKIKVESEKGKGTTFTISLPR